MIDISLKYNKFPFATNKPMKKIPLAVLLPLLILNCTHKKENTQQAKKENPNLNYLRLLRFAHNDRKQKSLSLLKGIFYS